MELPIAIICTVIGCHVLSFIAAYLAFFFWPDKFNNPVHASNPFREINAGIFFAALAGTYLAFAAAFFILFCCGPANTPDRINLSFILAVPPTGAVSALLLFIFLVGEPVNNNYRKYEKEYPSC